MPETPIQQLRPHDEHNRILESNVHPPHWQNPSPKQPYHLVVIGAGTAGLVTAAGAAGLGARVALIERELMGGDCLNIGCVPSKGVISAARMSAAFRDAPSFGISAAGGITIDFAKAMERVREKRAAISPADSAQRFADLGVDVFFGQGAFLDGKSISVSQSDGAVTRLEFKKAVIATGARAATPPIKGLETVQYLTNESLFSLTELPKRFGVVGSGPIGCEMAQAFARLGSEVFLFETSDHLLPREDEDAATLVQDQFQKDGIHLELSSADMEVGKQSDGSIQVQVTQNGVEKSFVVDQLLVAVGRTPNIDGLNLDGVNVNYHKRGVEVNDHLQTTNPKIFAAGDICSKYQFTHAADFMARIVIQNALFSIGPFGKKKVSDLIIPWATYTSPEIAHVGIYPEEAKDTGIEIDTYFQSLKDIDRAILNGQINGFIKIHTRKGTDRILGATIVAENAGDMISEITVAMKNKIGLAGIGATIHPYPTQAEAIRKLGDQFNKTKLTAFSSKVLGILRRLNVGK
ncbi:MAG: mercuric reductase [Mariniblastus sp.]|nr:mercuric reductase [Mariniblastus sp.]